MLVGWHTSRLEQESDAAIEGVESKLGCEDIAAAAAVCC